MSLNIKNERTHDLVRRLAALSGMSQTDAVTDAVERRLTELEKSDDADRQARIARILQLAREIRESLGPEGLARFTTDDLYDEETGLPR